MTIDYTAAHIKTLEMQVIRLRAERDTLKRENALLRSGIDAEAAYVDAFADGANLRTVGERVMDLTKDFGVPIV